MLGLLNIKVLGAALIGLAVLGAVLYIKHLQRENTQLTAQVTVLSVKLQEQNDAVERLGRETAEAAATAASEVARAKADAARVKADAARVYKARPSVPGDSCRSALDLLNGVTK